MRFRKLILGVGNPLRKDDGIGVYLAHKLEKLKMPEGVEVVDMGTGGLALIDLMREAHKVVFLDAVEMGETPGAVKFLSPEDMKTPAESLTFSSHEIRLPEILLLASLQGVSPEVVIVAVQPKNIGWGMGLSPELKRAIPRIVKCILNEIAI